MKKGLNGLFRVKKEDEILPSYVGIIVNHKELVPSFGT